jgi:hypothetical protein
MFLRAPRQQQLIQHLLHAKRLADGGTGPESADERRRSAGESMANTAGAADTFDFLAALAAQLGTALCDPLLHCSRSNLPEDLPGRIP